MRTLLKIVVIGQETMIRNIASQIPEGLGRIDEVGRLSKRQETRDWMFSTPWYEFDDGDFDEYVFDFVERHKIVAPVSVANDHDKISARLIICPVGETAEKQFSCLLRQPTLQMMARLELELEISPEATMPKGLSWSS